MVRRRPVDDVEECRLRKVALDDEQRSLFDGAPAHVERADVGKAIDLSDWRAEVCEHLLRQVGEDSRCSSSLCGERIFWIVHRNGKRTPYDVDGVPHFITCPARDRFRKTR